MEHLPSLPWNRVNDFLLQVGAARNLNEFNNLVLTHVADLIPHDYPILCLDLKHITNDVRFDIEHPTRPIDPAIIAVAGEPGTVADFNRYFRFHLPLTTGYFLKEPVVDFRPFARTEFVTDFIRPRKMVQCVGGWFRSYNIIIPRCKPAWPFTDRETLLCNIISPHLENLYDVLYGAATNRTTPLTRSMRIDHSASGLTPREQEIAVLLSERCTMAEIADRLFISRRTVEKHAENIYSKLNVTKKQEVREHLLGFRPYPHELD